MKNHWKDVFMTKISNLTKSLLFAQFVINLPIQTWSNEYKTMKPLQRSSFMPLYNVQIRLITKAMKFIFMNISILFLSSLSNIFLIWNIETPFSTPKKRIAYLQQVTKELL